MRTKNSSVYVIYKCAMSIDGFIDDVSAERLILSNQADFDRVDAVRAECDAILVGASTIRKDNPSLLIRSASRQQDRISCGLPANPIKVTLTRSGHLSKDFKFFTTGNSTKLVYCSNGASKNIESELLESELLQIVEFRDITPDLILNNLSSRGVRKLLIEGGSSVGTFFLSANLVDELQISIAPFFVGESTAPRFVNASTFPFHKANRMFLIQVEKIGDMALLTYCLQRTMSE